MRAMHVARWLGPGVLLVAAMEPSQAKPVVPSGDNLVIAKDTVLKAGTYVLRDGDKNGAIQITKDGVTLDGNGAVIDGSALEGIGVVAEGVSRITIKNLTIRGFGTGIRLARVKDSRVESVAATENFRNPEAKWGNGERAGGLVMEECRAVTVSSSVFAKNWNGIEMIHCEECVVQKNTTNPVDNWGLRLWRSSRNRIVGNDFSHAIRCAQEAHACDSAAMLIESGSNGNRFDDNVATHSGDGIFVRALDAVVSRDNVFTGNDASFAHNNGIEAWCPGNQWIRNKANRCGYGFWLGSSDDTLVLENEIRENGVEGTNAVNGTAGLAYIGGGTHVEILRNTITGNAGPGIHLRGNPPAFPNVHFLIQQNRIHENGEGIRIENAELVDVRANFFERNKKEEPVVQGDAVSDLTVVAAPRARGNEIPPRLVFRGGERATTVGEPLDFDAKESQCQDGRRPRLRWHFGDGAKEEGLAVRHAWAKPGFYRVSVTADDGSLAAIGHSEVYVVSKDAELADGGAAKWGAEARNWSGGFARLEDDANTKLKGKSSLHLVTNGGEDVVVWYPKGRDMGLNLTGKRALQMWVKFHNENDSSFQNGTPTIRLVGAPAAKGAEAPFLELKPKKGDLLGLHVPYGEGRWLFNFLEIPLGGNAEWELRASGSLDMKHVEALEIHADTWGAGFELWIDGVAFVK